MEWFGDNSSDDHKPRTDADDRLLAQVIHDTDADIRRAEIEISQAMERLLRLLPEYRYIIGTKRRQAAYWVSLSCAITSDYNWARYAHLP